MNARSEFPSEVTALLDHHAWASEDGHSPTDPSSVERRLAACRMSCPQPAGWQIQVNPDRQGRACLIAIRAIKAGRMILRFVEEDHPAWRDSHKSARSTPFDVGNRRFGVLVNLIDVSDFGLAYRHSQSLLESLRVCPRTTTHAEATSTCLIRRV